MNTCCCARRLWCKGVAFQTLICLCLTDNICCRSCRHGWTLQFAGFCQRRRIEWPSADFLLATSCCFLRIPIIAANLQLILVNLERIAAVDVDSKEVPDWPSIDCCTSFSTSSSSSSLPDVEIGATCWSANCFATANLCWLGLTPSA